jgi:hypothetical protein
MRDTEKFYCYYQLMHSDDHNVGVDGYKAQKIGPILLQPEYGETHKTPPERVGPADKHAEEGATHGRKETWSHAYTNYSRILFRTNGTAQNSN